MASATMEDNYTTAVNDSALRLLISNNSLQKNIIPVLSHLVIWPFVYVDVFMLCVFLRREMIRAEARYVLFAQTLVADSAFLILSDFVVVITFHVRLLLPVAICIPVCIFLEALSNISPAVIVAMCVERYVAICLPFRHVHIFTPGRTLLIITMIWFISIVKPFVDLLLLIVHIYESYFMELTFCYYEIMVPDQDQAEVRGILYFLNYVVILLILLFCYGSILFVIKRASADNKQAARKGHRTLLLHFLQLFLCTVEDVCPYVEAVVLETGDINSFTLVRNVNFLAFSILSRTVSPLIYGIRDETFYAAIKNYAKHNVKDISAEN
ncbi:odorant receptor 131-2-like [Denticeps clupeoides]|uniref:odorant receptor 131-2-like n=1 Tax=Denticeps clupeoides TaxID=299321 RepID=UPI0010A355BC|nr:odorant receptor 131-2-like [Denticeps clupeoides]